MAWAEADLRTKWHLDPCSCLATTDMGRKLWRELRPLFGGRSSAIEHKVPLAEAYLHSKWHLDAYSRLVTIQMGRKLGALPPFWGGEVGPDLTQSHLG